MIYMDNAATTFPKPPEVTRAVAGVMEKLGGNPGRGGHRLAVCAGRVLETCREALAALLGADEPERVIFTSSCTDALNTALRGTLHAGDEVLVSHAEHNAVMRVLKGYEAQGLLTVTVLSPDAQGLIQPHVLQRAVSARTALCVIAHASNVTGTVQPVRRLAAVCHENGFPLLLDAAQTAGVLDISHTGADMIALPGHKGLLGPMGTGVLYLGRGMLPRPLREGGTGSRSESMLQPAELPDRYESGTLNLPGIAGLLMGARFVRRYRAEIEEYEGVLTRRLIEGLRNLPGVVVYGDLDAPHTGPVSFNVGDLDSAEAADALSRAGFALRGGLHCAPSVHTWLGTLQSGAVRASLGPYNTAQDVDDLLAAMMRLNR